MKKIVLLISILGFLYSCQDVVDINLDTAAPKLVIDASINWKKGTTGNEQTIYLTTTTGYYDTSIPVVSGATVFAKNEANTTYTFIEIPNTGKYVCNNFEPVLNQTYTLTVIFKGQTYNATETLLPVAPIERLVQNNEGGFTGKNIDVKTYFLDPAGIDNYYMYKYEYANKIKPEYNVDDDRFFQGNEFFSVTRNRDLKVNDQFTVTHFGISKQYYNYMNVLLSITGSNGGAPFQSPPATVRGNIINNTNPSDCALGYFRLSETDSRTYTVQ